jgi:hypothetical protein
LKTITTTLLLAFIALTFEKLGGAEKSSALPTRIKVDGSFEEWKDIKSGWKETGEEGVRYPEDVDIKEFFYTNDDSYLYLFFKCKPTLQSRYEKGGGSGIFAYLYLDSDSNKRTGASVKDESGNSAMLGADIRIWVPIGVTSISSGGRTKEACSVHYEIKRWNAAVKDFTGVVRKEDSVHGNLIKHGKDGVEMALLLSDLKKRKGDQFDFICVEWANNSASRITMRIE